MFDVGTVILNPFPFTDMDVTKLRPAIILSNKDEKEITIACITSNGSFKDHPYSISILPSQSNGLKIPSFILMHNITSLSREVVLGEIGELTKSELQQCQDLLKEYLSL